MNTPNLPHNFGELILDQTTLNLPYGRQGTAAAGCGWVAVYNVMRLLDVPADMDEVRQEMEKLLILGGWKGTPFYALALYLKRKGFRVCLCFNRAKFARRARKVPACILFYLYKGTAILPCGHFTAFTPTKDNRFHFYNDFPGKSDDLRTMRQFRKDRPAYFMIQIEIQR